jgi:hypothetical protein
MKVLHCGKGCVSVVCICRYTSASEKTATTQRCKRIIAAFPPIQASLAPFDLDSQQREVLDRVRFVQYISGVINMPNATVTERFGVNTRMLALTGELPRMPFVMEYPYCLAEGAGCHGAPVCMLSSFELQ